MPAVTIFYPKDFFGPEEKESFGRNVKSSVATYMDAINPITGQMTDYASDPDKFIGLLLIPYDPYDAELTAPFLATIVTYDWPDRMTNIGSRIAAITERVQSCIPRNRVPAGQKTISFTFVAAGGWHSA